MTETMGLCVTAVNMTPHFEHIAKLYTVSPQPQNARGVLVLILDLFCIPCCAVVGFSSQQLAGVTCSTTVQMLAEKTNLAAVSVISAPGETNMSILFFLGCTGSVNNEILKHTWYIVLRKCQI